MQRRGLEAGYFGGDEYPLDVQAWKAGTWASIASGV